MSTKTTKPATSVEARLAEAQETIRSLEQQLAAPAAEASPLERRKTNANNTTVGLVTGVFPITRKDGSAVQGGFRVRLRISAKVNFGTAEVPLMRSISVEEAYFTAWDGPQSPLGSQLCELLETSDWALLRLYWDYSGKASDVEVFEKTNPTTGKTWREEEFTYAPDKRIFAFDLLASGGSRHEAPFSGEPTDEEVSF